MTDWSGFLSTRSASVDKGRQSRGCLLGQKYTQGAPSLIFRQLLKSLLYGLHVAFVVAPLVASFDIPITCSSLILLRFIALRFLSAEFHFSIVRSLGPKTV